jgi:hypothetical protein
MGTPGGGYVWEAELWDARAGEAVWRAEVDALDDVVKTPEDRFVTAALRKAVFDEIESITARMVRDGWRMRESFIEECLGNVHLILEREIPENGY